MALKVKFHNLDFPDEVMFDLGGLSVPNGVEVEISDETELLFIAKYGQSIVSKLGNNPIVTVSGNGYYSDEYIAENYPAPAAPAAAEDTAPPVVLLPPEDGEDDGDDDDEGKDGDS